MTWRSLVRTSLPIGTRPVGSKIAPAVSSPTILCVGDSETFGLHFADSIRDMLRLLLLGLGITPTFVGDKTTTGAAAASNAHRGVSGTTTLDHYGTGGSPLSPTTQALIGSLTPNLVIWFLAFNDAADPTLTANIVTNYSALINAAAAASPNTRHVVVTGLPETGATARRANIVTINAALPGMVTTLQGSGVKVVGVSLRVLDFYAHMRWDFLHFSSVDAHVKLADALLPAVLNALGYDATWPLYIPRPYVEYFVSEADSANGTGVLLDAGPAPKANMTLTQNGGQPVYATASTGRSLQWTAPQADDGGARVQVTPGSKVATAVSGKTEHTLEAVVTWPVSAQLDTTTACIFGLNQSDAENDVISLWMAGGQVIVDYTTAIGFPEYAAAKFFRADGTDWVPSGRHVLHAVVDTKQSDKEKRIRLFVDGVEKLKDGYTAESHVDRPIQGEEIGIPWGHPEGFYLSIGCYNNALYYNGSLVRMSVHQAAAFESALTEAQIAARARILAVSDDPPLMTLPTGTKLLANGYLQILSCPSLSAGMTVCGWARMPAAAGLWQGLLAIQQDDADPSATLDREDVSGLLKCYAVDSGGGYAETAGYASASVESWFFFAVTLGASAGARDQKFYAGNLAGLALIGSLTYQSGFAPNRILLGESGYSEFGNPDLQAVRVYAAELSLTQLYAEMVSGYPVYGTPWARWDLLNSSLIDLSGNARNLSIAAGRVAYSTTAPTSCPPVT